MLVAVDDKVKVVGKGEFAKCLLVCGTIANISKVIDVNISSSSSSSKSNTHNALKMMRKLLKKPRKEELQDPWLE